MKKLIYEFNKERHLHTLGGKALTGCTTILSVIAKPALIPWAAKITVEYIRENIRRLNIMNPKQFKQLLLEAKSAHSKRKEKAGNFGTKTHDEISLFISRAISENTGYMIDGATDNEAVKNFIDWAIKGKVKFLDTERNIYSKKLWLGGIVDFVYMIDGKVWIGDIKTSNSGIYAENFWQCAGYDIMLKEMKLYEKVEGYLIVNLKENGEFNEKRSISIKENKKAFLSCLAIYRIQEKLKTQIK